MGQNFLTGPNSKIFDSTPNFFTQNKNGLTRDLTIFSQVNSNSTHDLNHFLKLSLVK